MVDIEKEEQLDKSLDPMAPTTLSLIKEGNDLTEQIINETDPNKLNDLTQLFEMNKRKKDIARTNKLSNLLEVIDDEVILRFNSYADTFDNDQLVKYMESTQRAITNMSQSAEKIPQIQINNQTNEIHVGTSGLNRESRAKVLDVVNSILKGLDNEKDVIDVEVKENEEGCV